MTAMTHRPGLFNNPIRRAVASERGLPPPQPKKKGTYFMGKDYHSAVEFLESIGIKPERSWGCIHNLGSLEGLSSGLVYVCPGADEKPDFKAIMDQMSAGTFRVIYLFEMNLAEVH